MAVSEEDIVSDNLPPNQPGQPAPEAPVYRAQPNNQQPAPGQPGGPVQPGQPYGAPVATSVPGKTLGIVGLVLSFIMSLVGLVLSIIAVVQSKKAGVKNIPGIIGIIIGALGTIGGLIVVGLLIAAIGMGAGEFGNIMDSVAYCESNPAATVEIMGQQLSCDEILGEY